MRVPSDEIPQADNLIDVVRTVVAISQGARTDQDIGQAIGKVARQGRYYRKAAEIIGLITNRTNNATLTHAGQSFVQSDPTVNNPALL
jgi:hypothetical protein